MDALKQFLSAERVMLTTRADGQRRERWHVTTGADEVRILTTAELDESLARLDADRHPWGAPGEVPTDPGDYWLAGALRDRVSAVTMQLWTKGPEWFGEANVGSHGHLVRMAQQFGYQFRTRWTPAPPTTTEETNR